MWSMPSFNRSQESSGISRRKAVLHLHLYWIFNLNSLPFLGSIFRLHCFSEHSTYIIITVQVKQKILPVHTFHRQSARTWVVLEETKRNLFRRRCRICSCWYLGSSLRLVLNSTETYKPSCYNMTHLMPSTLTSLTPEIDPVSNLTCNLLFRLLLDKDRKWFRRIMMKQKQRIEGSLLTGL